MTSMAFMASSTSAKAPSRRPLAARHLRSLSTEQGDENARKLWWSGGWGGDFGGNYYGGGWGGNYYGGGGWGGDYSYGGWW